MVVSVHSSKYRRLTEADLAPFRDIPAAVVCDALERTGGMASVIKALTPGVGFVGQALTVRAGNGSNAAIHHAVKHVAWPGCVLVVDAEGREDRAVWGGVINANAWAKGVVGLVVDGCVRDAAELRRGPMPVFCRGFAPNGPTKEDTGAINVPVVCGGLVVHPGDLIVADDDGVSAAPLAELEVVREKGLARIRQKDAWTGQVRGGGAATADLWDLPPPRDST